MSSSHLHTCGVAQQENRKPSGGKTHPQENYKLHVNVNTHTPPLAPNARTHTHTPPPPPPSLCMLAIWTSIRTRRSLPLRFLKVRLCRSLSRPPAAPPPPPLPPTLGVLDVIDYALDVGEGGGRRGRSLVRFGFLRIYAIASPEQQAAPLAPEVKFSMQRLSRLQQLLCMKQTNVIAA